VDLRRETLPQLAGSLIWVLPTGLARITKGQVGMSSVTHSTMYSGVLGFHTYLPPSVLHPGCGAREAESPEAVVPAQVKSSQGDAKAWWAGKQWLRTDKRRH
jgi:hypothetical protein